MSTVKRMNPKMGQKNKIITTQSNHKPREAKMENAKMSHTHCQNV